MSITMPADALSQLRVNPDWASLPLFDRTGWTRVRFGDVVTQLKEQVDPVAEGVERYVAGEHMETDNVHITRWGNVGDGYLGPAFIRRFSKGHVLYGSRRTYLKKVAVAEWDGVTANTTFVLQAKEDRLLQDLLPWLMLSDRFTQHSVRESKGSTNPYINFPDIAKFEFDLPPLDQQRRITKLLWALNDTSKRTTVLAGLVESLPRSAANHVTGVKVPPDGESKALPLGEVADVIDCKHRTPTSAEEGVAVVSPGNINWGPLDLGRCRKTSLREYGDLMDHCDVRPGDMVMGRNQKFGILAVVQDGQRFVLGQDTVLIQPKTIGSHYLYLAMQSSHVRSQIEQLSTGSTFKRINLKDIRSLSIPCAKEAQQREAAMWVERHIELHDALQEKATALGRLRSELLNGVCGSSFSL